MPDPVAIQREYYRRTAAQYDAMHVHSDGEHNFALSVHGVDDPLPGVPLGARHWLWDWTCAVRDQGRSILGFEFAGSSRRPNCARRRKRKAWRRTRSWMVTRKRSNTRTVSSTWCARLEHCITSQNRRLRLARCCALQDARSSSRMQTTSARDRRRCARSNRSRTRWTVDAARLHQVAGQGLYPVGRGRALILVFRVQQLLAGPARV